MMYDGSRSPYSIPSRLRTIMFTLGVLIILGPAYADSIVIGGVQHDDVYIRTTANMYYVEFPDEGVVRSVPKDEVDKERVSIDSDEEKRREIHARWRKNNPTLVEQIAPPKDSSTTVKDTTPVDAALVRTRGRSLTRAAQSNPRIRSAQVGPQPNQLVPSDIVTDGVIDRLTLRDVPLREALPAMLRPLNLAYVEKDGYLFISTPEKLRAEADEPLEIRYYELGPSGETLFKIVVGNPGGFR